MTIKSIDICKALKTIVGNFFNMEKSKNLLNTKGEDEWEVGGIGASSPDVSVMPHGAASSSSSPGPADPCGSSTVSEGQVAENER
jgi:hypothetical protein